MTNFDLEVVSLRELEDMAYKITQEITNRKAMPVSKTVARLATHSVVEAIVSYREENPGIGLRFAKSAVELARDRFKRGIRTTTNK